VQEKLVVSAKLVEFARVCNWIKALALRSVLPQSTLFAIQLCCEEALSNIARYGFAHGDASSREVQLSVEQAGDLIILTIKDRGMAFNPLGVPPPPKPATVEEASAGGWGIQLIRKFARSQAYERRDGVNCLTLCFGIDC